MGIEILSQKRDEDKRMPIVVQTVRQTVELVAVPFLALSAQLIDRLAAVQKHIILFDETHSEQSSMQPLQIQATVAETQVTASRAGTILYLESMIFTARTIDDIIVFNFLAGRHRDDRNSMFLDVIFSSFQVLKRSHDGDRKTLRVAQTDLFIRNKLPSILSAIVGSSFGMVSSEQAITSSWEKIKTELTTAELLLSGQVFVHVCSLHHLLPSEAANQLIGSQQVTSNLPKALRSKDDIVSQINAGHSRIDKLVDELVHVDGSGAAISQAMVETIVAYRQSTETHHLMDMSNAMLKKPAAINFIAMFIPPSYWMGPLCTLINEWRWGEINGESQPVYEEFGSILLLVIASKQRLNLSMSEMGMQAGFVAEFLDQEGIENATLSDESLIHLSDWIYAFYVAEALSDEVTTSCSPQEFYMLIPNLLRQSVLAHQRGKLTHDALSDGLECELIPAYVCLADFQIFSNPFFFLLSSSQQPGPPTTLKLASFSCRSSQRQPTTKFTELFLP